MKTQHAFMVPATLVATMLVGGCSLSSPYVRISNVPGTCNDEHCSIENAIAYSRSVRGAYRDVLDKYARLRSNSGAATIAIGAAALGAAIGNANSDVFAGLGLIGATQYGYSAWYGNPPREALFAQTIQALVCAEGATSKLRFPASATAQADRLVGDASEVSVAVDQAAVNLSDAVNAAKAYMVAKRANIERLPEKSRKAARNDLDGITKVFKAPIATSEDALDKVSAARDALNNALAALLARERVADSAGYALVSAVDRIVAATDVEAQKTLPDPAAAFAIVSGFGGTAGKFIPSADAVTALDNATKVFAKAEGASDLDARLQAELQPLLTHIGSAQQQLSAAASRMAGITKMITDLAALPGADAVSAVDKCTIAGIGALGAVPSSVQITAAKSASISVDLQGGKTPYRVEWSGSAPTGITLSQPGFGDSRFVVIGTTDSTAGDSKIKVTDGSGRLLEVAVTVK